MANPYERRNDDDTLDIPDFVEDKTSTSTDSSVDMSIFKMSDDELYDDATNDEVEDDDFDDLKPKKKKKGNAPLIICFVIIFILLGLCAGAAIYAIKQRQAYVKVNTQYLQVLANEEAYKKQIAEKDATIEALNKQIEALQNAGSQGGEGKLVYEITDGPITFRKEPTSDAEKTTFNGKGQAETGEKFNVIEVVADKDVKDGPSWAKVADNIYFCIGENSAWAKQVNQ